MSIFVPNPSGGQDIGGVFSEPGKNPSQLDNQDVPLIDIENSYPEFYCRISCIVNESGVEYPTNTSGCYIIPSFPDVTVSGIDICAFIAANCPAYETVAFDANTQVLTLTDQGGAADPVTITVNTSGCITGDGTLADPVRFDGDILTINAGTTANVADASNGSAGAGCNETIHFWSSDDTVNVNVAEGSVVVDIVLASPAVATYGAGGFNFTGNDGSGVAFDVCCNSGLDVSGDQLTLTQLRNGVAESLSVTLPSGGGSGSVSVVTLTPSGFVHLDGSGTTTNVDVCQLVQNSCGATVVSNAGGVTISGNDGSGVNFNVTENSGLVYSGTTLTLNQTVNGVLTPLSVTVDPPLDPSAVCAAVNSTCGATAVFNSSGLTVSGNDGAAAQVDICCVSGFQTVGTNIVFTETRNGVNTIWTAALPTVSGTTSDSVSIMVDTPSGFIHNDGSGTTFNFDACAKINAQCPATVTNNASGLTITGTDGTTANVDVCCVSGVSVSGTDLILTQTRNGANETFSTMLPAAAVSSITLTPSGFVHADGSGNNTGVDICSIVQSSCGATVVSNASGITISGNDGSGVQFNDCCISGYAADGSGNIVATHIINGSNQTFTFPVGGAIVANTCLVGSGTAASPLQLQVDVSGGLACGSSGITAQLNTTNCIQGQGTIASPLTLFLDPSGGITCGASGLTLEGSGCAFAISYETGSCPSGVTAPNDPTPDAVENTIQQEVWDDCILFWVYDGTNWSLDKEYKPAVSGVAGTDSVSSMTATPSGFIHSDGSGNNFNFDACAVINASCGATAVSNAGGVTISGNDGNGINFNVAQISGVNIAGSTLTVTDLVNGAPVAFNATLPVSSVVSNASGLTVSGSDGTSANVDVCCISGYASDGSGNIIATHIINGMNQTFSFPVGNTVSGTSCSGMTMVEEVLTGSGTFAAPYTACDIEVTQPCFTNVTIDNRDLIPIEFGQGGNLFVDSDISGQDRYVVPSGTTLEVVKAQYTLATPPISGVTVEFFTTQGATNGTRPSTGSPDLVLSIPSGVVFGEIPGLVGTYNNLVHIQERVSDPGVGASQLRVTLLGKLCLN